MEKFKITKTIRFKAEPQKAERLQAQAEALMKNPNADIATLVIKGFEFINHLEELIFVNDEKKYLRKDITLHFRWLRQNVKNEWHDWKQGKIKKENDTNKSKQKQAQKSNSPFASLLSIRDKFDDAKSDHSDKKTKSSDDKKLPLGSVPFLKNELQNINDYWREVLEALRQAFERPEENRMRRADIAKYLGELSKRQMLPALMDFINDLNDKKSEEKINTLKKLAQAFKELLETCQNAYLSAKSSGINLTRASFNYYTLNKKEKNYTEERERIISNLSKPYFERGRIPQIIQDLRIDENLSIEKLYEYLKKYKAEQKQQFQEAVSQGLLFDELIEKFPLFETIKPIFNEFVAKTNAITQKSTALQNSFKTKGIKDEINKIKRERGQMFLKGKFKHYTELCDVYKRVAQNKGKLKAALIGIEKEKIDSQKLQYWALIGKQNNKYKLYLIPKEKVQEAYSEISRQGRIENEVSTPLYYFESFTFRALKKLCFGVNGNTFLPEIKKELTEYNQADFGEHTFRTGNVEQDEQNLIQFYQKVLNTDFVLRNLRLPHAQLSEVVDTKYNNLQEFKIAIEKVCYAKQTVLNSRVLRLLETDYKAQIMELSSLDLNKENPTNLKAHTILWNSFWAAENEANHFTTRINPEISIFWREPKASRIEKYGKGTPLYDEKKKNRYLHPQFTVAFTFNENALSNELNYAFEGFEKKKEALNDFNQQINQEFKKGLENQILGAFGIDTGEAELATIGLTENGKPFPTKLIRLKTEKLNFEKQGFFKDGTPREKPYRAIDNMSYFLKKELYDNTFRDNLFQETYAEIFEEFETTTIDLTCAKMICRHIVLNGDLHMRTKLNLLNAKRQIRQAQILNPSLELKFEEDKILIPETDENRKVNTPWKAIYHTNEELEQIQPINSVKELLSTYLKEVKVDESIEIENINRYRKVVAGNMVGVIAHLYNKYPILIAIENLAQGTIEKHRLRYQGVMDRPLETALYRKFQTQGLTPPISDAIAIREALTEKKNNKKSQLGVLQFVDEQLTSKTCPNCGKNAYEGKRKELYLEEKKQGVFSCTCGFHNINNPMGLNLHSNDAVAAFNIAKRGIKNIK